MDKFYDFNEYKEGFKRYGGSDKKETIIIEDKRFMLKYNNLIKESQQNEFTSDSRNNVFSEYIACHIIQSMGLPVQNTLIGERKGHIVVACEDFCTEGSELNEFEKYGNSIDLDFEECRYPEVKDVIDVIRRNKQMDPTIIEKRFWDTFCVDALLGNFDRHTGNWGYLFNDKTQEFNVAPIYDCGACLYPMLNDKGMEDVLKNEDKINERIYKYPKAAFLDKGEKLDYYTFMTDKNVYKAYPLLNKAVIDMSKTIDFNKIKEIIENTPKLSETRRDFYQRMISERYEKIIVPAIEIINEKPLSQQMEQTWTDFFNRPKDERISIKWNGKSYRIAEFEDMYLAQCKKDGIMPNNSVKEHFWKNCVDRQGYEPKFCKNPDISR